MIPLEELYWVSTAICVSACDFCILGWVVHCGINSGLPGRYRKHEKKFSTWFQGRFLEQNSLSLGETWDLGYLTSANGLKMRACHDLYHCCVSRSSSWIIEHCRISGSDWELNHREYLPLTCAQEREKSFSYVELAQSNGRVGLRNRNSQSVVNSKCMVG